MGRIADEIIQEIRDRVDIVDVVGRHLTLKKSGRNHLGLCPFHSEKTPSFNVSSERQSYYCFGCHEGGTVFTFLMQVENLTFPEAVRTLARDCGVEVPESGGSDRGESEALYRANEIAQAEYRKSLSIPGNEGSAYLAKRGIDAETIEEFGIGFVPDRWNTIAVALHTQKIPGEVGARAGLLAERQSGGYYDRLRNRVTFPIRDVRGRVIGFGGRAVEADQEPKYLNTPESPIFRKREAFYGYPDALGPIRSAERAVVVEGYFDRIALHRAGIPGAVATCGTALTPDHVRDLRRRTRSIVLLFDGDEAGQRALEKALEILLPEGVRVSAVPLPAGDDPDSYLAREGAEALRARVDAAPPALDAVIGRAAARGHNTPWEKADAVADVAKLLALVPEVVERSEFSTQLALAVGTEPKHVEAAVLAHRRGTDPHDVIPVEPRNRGPEDRIAGRLVRSLINYPALGRRVPSDEILDLLSPGPSAEALQALLANARSSADAGSVDVEGLCEGLGAESSTVIRELAADGEDLDEMTAGRIVDDTLSWLRKKRHLQKSQALTAQLRGGGDDWRAVLEAKMQMKSTRNPSPTGIPT